MGTVFLLCVTVGALAFGPLLRAPFLRRALPAPAGPALLAASTLVGLRFLAEMDHDRLFPYLKRFGCDYSLIGTWRVTALIAGASLVIPGFVAGAVLAGTRQAARLGALVLGAATGHLIFPAVVDALGKPSETPTPFAWQVLFVGTVIAAMAGGLWVLFAERSRARVAGLAIAVAAIGLPWLSPGLSFWNFSPWYAITIQPELVMPTSAGLVTVEPARLTPQTVTVDRKRVTATSEEERIDSQRLGFALSLLDRSSFGPEGPRVLLVGQITPLRDFVLKGLGVQQLDRTAAWFRAMEAVEQRLFGTQEPLGRRIPCGEARRGLAEGAYDLVIVMPTHGPALQPKSLAFQPWATVNAPVLGGLDLPEHTVAVAWTDAASPLATRDLGEHVLVALERFRTPSIAIVRGPAQLDPDESRPMIFRGGEPRASQSVLEVLTQRANERGFALVAEVFAQLEQGSASGAMPGAGELARGLHAHYAAQKRSSPFEALHEQIEFDEDSLRGYFDSVRAKATLDPLTREVWESAAWLLTAKRLPQFVVAYLEPLLERYGEWLALERAVAKSYVEQVEPERAFELYRGLVERYPSQAEVLIDAAGAAEAFPESDEALALLEQVRAVRTDVPEVERAWAAALFRAGDPEGARAIEAFLREHPEDEGLRSLLETGQEVGPAHVHR